MAFDILLDVMAAWGKKVLLVFLQNEAGQASGSIGGSINTDAVGTNLWGHRRGVTVYDKFSMLCLTRQEWLANIQKIIAILAVESHAGPYAGVTEEVIAKDH